MGRSFLLLIFLFQCAILNAQWVREDDTSKVWMEDGIYMSKLAFLTNTPDYTWGKFVKSDWRFQDSLRREGIASEIRTEPESKRDLDVNVRYLLGYFGDSGVVIERKQVWGFCINGEPYRHIDVARRNNFRYINILGTISFLQYSVSYEDPFYWSADPMRMEPQYRNETVDVVIDFEGPGIYRNVRSELERILQRDEELYELYLKEKRKSKAIYSYINRYNKRVPITFKTREEVSKQDKP